MIYFLQSVDGGPVKIGFTDDFPTRLKSLESHYGQPLALLASFKGGRDEEQFVHAKFAHLRLGRTEQFRPAADLMEFIGRPLLVGANPDAVEAMPCKLDRKGTISLTLKTLERAKLAASLMRMSLADYASDVLTKAADRDIAREAKKLAGGEKS